MRGTIAVGVALGLSMLGAVPVALAQAVSGGVAVSTDAADDGGRGLITGEMATGMFINPTSGILDHGQFTLQYCARVFHAPGPDQDTVAGHGAIAAFGLLDWIEIGAAALIVDVPGPEDTQAVGGPTIKVRVLRERGPWPEVGIGGIFLFGDAALERKTLYVAVSKGVKLSDGRFFRSVRGHIGFRQTWFEVGEDGSFGYVGAELEFFRYTYLVAEVSNKSAGAVHIPWAAGIQVRHPAGFGFTLAVVQNGNLPNPGVYVGVGINYQ